MIKVENLSGQQFEIITGEERVRRDPRGLIGVTVLDANTFIIPVVPEVSSEEISAEEGGEVNG